MKLGFLFGAGAEMGYGLPSGGQFALEIFRRDVSKSKKLFKTMRDNVKLDSSYAAEWLPDGFDSKNISSFGKTVFQNIIKDTLEHNRDTIVRKLNEFQIIAEYNANDLKKKQGIDIDEVLTEITGVAPEDLSMKHMLSFIDEFKEGDVLFESNYFSSLLTVYKLSPVKIEHQGAEIVNWQRIELKKILMSIIQLLVGALSENLTKRINGGLFSKKDDEIDFFDDFGEILQLNYSASGLVGMEYLLDKRNPDLSNSLGKCLLFAQNIVEDIYSVVLDYKSLIDMYWHYLYTPSTDWAKFCKICIFLLNVRDYMVTAESHAKAKRDSLKESFHGYYQQLNEAIKCNLFEVHGIATTNYCNFIAEEIFKGIDGKNEKVVFLNGSTEMWYDPYLNRIGSEDELAHPDNHILVPLMFTQSGTKPMTSIQMSEKYVETYNKWKEVDKIVIVGFGFGSDDEHINGILRTLIDSDNKKIVVVTREKQPPIKNHQIVRQIAKKLRVSELKNISVIQMNSAGSPAESEKSLMQLLSDD